MCRFVVSCQGCFRFVFRVGSLWLSEITACIGPLKLTFPVVPFSIQLAAHPAGFLSGDCKHVDTKMTFPVGNASAVTPDEDDAAAAAPGPDDTTAASPVRSGKRARTK